MKEGKELEVRVVSLKEVLFHDYVDFAVLPTLSGEITVLPNHVALVSHLAKGSIRLCFKNEQKEIRIEGGFAEVSLESRLIILLS